MATTILAVDDSVTMRKVLEITFAGPEFRCITVPGADAALDKLKSDKPALVVADVTLEGKNGYDLCKAIKSNPAFRDIPICFISARSDPASIDKGRACGAADYFVKPVDVGRLLARLDELIAQTAARPS